MKNCTRTQLQLFSLEETNLNEVRVLQNDMLVLIIQGIIISQGNNKLFYLLLIVSEVMIVLFGWLSKEQQSKFLLPPKSQHRITPGKFIRLLWKKTLKIHP